jgi:hypothetical protein
MGTHDILINSLALVDRLNCCWSSQAQSFLSSVFSRPMTKDFYSHLDMHVFRNGASSSTKEGSVFLCRRYVCCTTVSAWVYPGCQRRLDHYGLCALFVTALYQNLYNIYRDFMSRQACAAGYALTHAIILKLRLVSWKVVGLTAAKSQSVTLRLAVYRQSVCFGVKPLETHDQRFSPPPKVNPCCNSPYVTSSLTRRWVYLLRICLVFRQVYISHI